MSPLKSCGVGVVVGDLVVVPRDDEREPAVGELELRVALVQRVCIRHRGRSTGEGPRTAGTGVSRWPPLRSMPYS